MRILFETYSYPTELIKRAFGLSDVRLLKSCFADVSSFCRINDDSCSFNCVGYFYCKDLEDCVFVMPKVFIQQESDKTYIRGLDNNLLNPQDLLNVKFDEGQNKLSRETCSFVFDMAIWLYQSIKRYSERKVSKNIVDSEILRVSSSLGNTSETLLDSIVSLFDFYHRHPQLFSFKKSNRLNGYGKVNWQKTVSTQNAFWQDDVPIYMSVVSKTKSVNYEDEAIVLFLSVMNFISEQYFFEKIETTGYDIYKSYEIAEFIESGLGLRKSKQMLHKYFSDDFVELCQMLVVFFECAQESNSCRGIPEMTIVERYDRIFEDMVECLIGENLPKALKYLKTQKSGYSIDHIYEYASLLHPDEESRKIYFIGDSKYYPEKRALSKNDVEKQYVYAKNIVQYCVNIFENGVDETDFRSDEERIRREFSYRDDVTEGYNITPNFFIRGQIFEDHLFDVQGVFHDYDLKLDDSEGSYRCNRQFRNRLFDRDTLLLQTYNINFLYVLAAYIDGADDSLARSKIRNVFRDNIRSVLSSNYDIYRLVDLCRKDEIEQFLDNYFRDVIGKVYSFQERKSGDYCLLIAIAKNENDSEDNRSYARRRVFVDGGRLCIGDEDVTSVVKIELGQAMPPKS